MSHKVSMDRLFDPDEFDDAIKQGLDNCFLIYTGQKSYTEFTADGGGPHFFLFDPEETPTKSDIEDMIHIYEDYEEYEKCGELLNLISYL